MNRRLLRSRWRELKNGLSREAQFVCNHPIFCYSGGTRTYSTLSNKAPWKLISQMSIQSMTETEVRMNDFSSNFNKNLKLP